MDGSSPQRMIRSANDASRPQDEEENIPQPNSARQVSPNSRKRTTSHPVSPQPTTTSPLPKGKKEKKEEKKLKKREEKEAKKKSKSEKKKSSGKRNSGVPEDAKQTASAPAVDAATTRLTPPPVSFPADGWSCSACTFWNQAAFIYCEICNSPRIQTTDGSARSVHDHQAAQWWYCSRCTLKNLPGAGRCEACNAERAADALTEVSESPIPLTVLETSKTDKHIKLATAKTPQQVNEEAANDDGRDRGHKRTATLDRAEDEFWLPEEELDTESDESEGKGDGKEEHRDKKLSRSDNSPPLDSDSEDLLREEMLAEIERRERVEQEREAKRRAEEERRKKEEEDRIPLEIATIERAEFFCTNDGWEAELYSDDEDSPEDSDPTTADMDEEERSRKEKYCDEDGLESSQRRVVEEHPGVVRDSYEVIESTTKLLSAVQNERNAAPFEGDSGIYEFVPDREDRRPGASEKSRFYRYDDEDEDEAYNYEIVEGSKAAAIPRPSETELDEILMQKLLEDQSGSQAEKERTHIRKQKEKAKRVPDDEDKDNYTEDVEETVAILRADMTSKRAQLRDSLYYTDDNGQEEDMEQSNSGDETDSSYYGNDDNLKPVDAKKPEVAIQSAPEIIMSDDPDRLQAQRVAEEEEELFRLALLRSGEERQGDAASSTGTHPRATLAPIPRNGSSTGSTSSSSSTSLSSGGSQDLVGQFVKLAYGELPSVSPTTSGQIGTSKTASLPLRTPEQDRRNIKTASLQQQQRPLALQPLIVSASMNHTEHSRRMHDLSKKSDRYLQELTKRCHTLLPILATHLAVLQSLFEHRIKLGRFEGLRVIKDDLETDYLPQKSLIPRLQRAMRISRRSNFRLYNDIGTTMPFIGSIYTSAEMAVRSNESLFQITCEYLSSLPLTEELVAIYRGAMIKLSSSSVLLESCRTTIIAFAKERHFARLSAAELKRANDYLKRTITQRSVLDVLQSSALSLVQATRHLVTQLKQESRSHSSSSATNSGLLRISSDTEVASSNDEGITPRTRATEAAVDRDNRRHQIEWLESAIKSVEARLSVEEDRGAERNWNKEFQDILDSFSITETEKELEAGEAALLKRGHQADKLCNLAKDFVAAAKMYGKIIISEVFLPYKQKTIKPINIGGVAGGEKYVHRGILFKFAMDWENLYGGDEYSAKVASHELKGLARYFSCAVRGLHFPLMALIDYRGFRLVASSILPISRDETLVYGSCDMGSTVRNDNKVFAKLMEKAGRLMNIKGHLAGKSGSAFLYAPTDIEGHLGRDKRFYVLDFARTFPPSTPNVKAHPRGFLYQLLRPEFVFKYKAPLSSDAFSVFGKKSNAVDNLEIREATNYLLNTLIPGFANWLERQFEVDDDEPVLSSNLSVLLHREGINNRYLGVVRKHCRNQRLRQFLLREMVARTIKNIMRSEMREKTKNVHWQRDRQFAAQAGSPQPRIELGSDEEHHSQEISFSMVIARFFNVVIGLEGDRSKHFWDVQMRDKLQHAFHDIELPQDAPIRPSSHDFLPLFERIQQLGGIRLSKQVLKELEETPEKVIFAYPDIIKLRSRVKHMNIVEESEALSVKLTALETKNEHLALRMLRYSREHYEAAVRASTDNAKTLLRLAEVLKELAIREPGPQQLKIELGDSSIERFRAAYELNPADEKVIYQTGNVACEIAEAVKSAHFYAKARECYTLSLRAQPHHQKEVAERALVLMARAETDLSVVNFQGAFELFKAVLNARPDDVLIIFLCAEICYSWARAIGDCTSRPYKKAIKFYQRVVDIARATNKTASPSTDAHRQSDHLGKRPRLPFLAELEGMSHVLSTSSPDTYDKFLKSKTSKKHHSKHKRRTKEIAHAEKPAASPEHATAKGTDQSLMRSMPESDSGNDSFVSSSSWRRSKTEKKEKKENKRSKKYSKKESSEGQNDGHTEDPSTTSKSRRLSLKLPKSPRGEKDSSGSGEHQAKQSHLSPPPQHHAQPPSPSSHHLVSKLFSSTKLFSRKESLGKGGSGDKANTIDSQQSLSLPNLDIIEAERRRKEADELEEKRKQEDKAREEKRQLERERERRERDPWRCIYVLFRLRLAFYNDLTATFPTLGMFWLKMGDILKQQVQEATLTHDLHPEQEREYLSQAAAHYTKALTLNPEYMRILQEDHDSSYITDDGDLRTERPARNIEALFAQVRDILQVAQTSPALQIEIGNACHKLGLRKLFLAPVASHISDSALTAIIKGGSSGNCLESLAPYLAKTLNTLRLKGLTSLPTQQLCHLIKSCTKLVQLSMPHCCYRDTYMPLQTLSIHCRNLTSLDFGAMCIIWKDDFEQLAKSSQGLTSLDLYYLHNLTSSIVDRFLAECKHLRRLRLPCLTPYVVKRTGKRRAKDSDVDKQRIEGGGVSFSDEVFRKWALKYKDSLAELEELHMDGYSNLMHSMLPLVETFRSLRVLHLENNRGIDDRCLIQLTSHCTSLTDLHLAHCVNIGDASLAMVARTCPQLRVLNVALTKIGGNGVEAIAKHCSQLQELWLGCPYRVRDDLLKNLIYTSFVSLKKLALFEAAEAQFLYSISAARTKGIVVEIDQNTMLPAFIAKKCTDAAKPSIQAAIRCISSEDTFEQVNGLRVLAYEHFVPFDKPETEDNKRYFAKMGGIPLLLDLMGPANRDQVRIKATSAVWNFAGSEELQRLLLGEGVLGPIIRSLHSVIPELQQAGVGALWPYLEFEDVGEKALEMGVVESLLHILDASKLQLRWHVLGCLVSIAENVNCVPELMAKGAARKILLSGYCSNFDELIITRYLAVLVLGFLTLDGSYEDELTSDGAIEQIQNFVLERHPNEVARNEEVVTNDQGIKWKFIRPFMRLTYSRHLPIQRLGAFALAALSRRPANVKTMVEEGMLGRLVCLSWSNDQQLRQLISIPLQAIHTRYAATIGKSIPKIPTLEQIAIHTIQHDGNLCGLKNWLSSPERPAIPEALKQKLEVKVLLATRQNLEKKVVYRGAPEWRM